MTSRTHPTPEEIEASLADASKGKIPFIVGSILVIAALVAAVVYWQMPKEVEIHWTTGSVDRGDIVITAAATGKLEPRRTVTVGAEISGKLATVDVEANEEVQEGQILATFDTEVLEGSLALTEASMASSRANVRRAEIGLEEARTEENRSRLLVEREVAPAAELETARVRRIRAEADLDQARADLQRSQAQLREVRTQLSRAEITSPIDGVILARHVEPGQTVASSLQAPELFVVAEDLREMSLRVWIDEADIALVQIGQEATFTVSAYPGQTFDAQIRSVALQPTETNNVITYIAELTVNNPEYLLRPGMTASAMIVTGSQKGVLRVPNAALRFTPPVQEEEGSSLIPTARMGRGWGRQSAGPSGVGTVHILKEGVPTPVRVQTGRTDGRFTAITSDELSEGEDLVTGFTEGPPEEGSGASGGRSPAGQGGGRQGGRS